MSSHRAGTSKWAYRTLFFNPAQDSAWVFDIGVSNIYNNASDKSSKVDLLNVSSTVNSTTTTIPSVPVSVGNLNRTYLNLAGGKEWYLWGNADPHDKHSNMKAGVDLGGRWGTEKIDLNEIEHRTDTIGGVFFAAHADYETPCGDFPVHRWRSGRILVYLERHSPASEPYRYRRIECAADGGGAVLTIILQVSHGFHSLQEEV